jgi:GTP cyclohydrolase I
METQRPTPQISESALAEIGDLIFQLLVQIGEDPTREGLEDTPNRVARVWKDFIDYDAGNTDVTFQQTTTNQMVVVSPIRVFSLCEHHLLPFRADITIGYIAEEKVLGLSKFARIAQKYAHRLQIQERMVDQIADEVEELTGSPNVAVFARGLHMCMAMRGVMSDAIMTTSVMRGLFFFAPMTRQEFLTLATANR